MSNYKTSLQSNNEALSSNNIDLQGLIDQANALPDAGGVELPTLTNEGTALDLLSGKQLISQDGDIVTGTIITRTADDLTYWGAEVTVPAGYYASNTGKSVNTVTRATPSISVNSSGLITASVTQSSGYVTSGTQSATKQLTTQAAKTVTPTKSSQTAVASGVYTTGAVTVGAIPSEYITTTDATASADEIMSGETAYVNGSKVTGTFSIDSELSAQDDLIAQLSAAVNSLPDAGSGEPTLQNKTVTPTTSKQTVTADSGYDGLGTVTVNAMTTATQATPSISVSSSGLITASATQTAGYVAAGTKSATKQLTTQAAQTITPSTTDKTIASGIYLTGTQTIKGDANLIPANIVSGKTIFGVVGTATIDSGSTGGSIETVTLSVIEDGPFNIYAGLLKYIDSNGLLKTSEAIPAGEIVHIQKNSIIVNNKRITHSNLQDVVIANNYGIFSYYVTGDFYVYANM